MSTTTTRTRKPRKSASMDVELVFCPRGCGAPLCYRPTGRFVSFCVLCLAFLGPNEFSAADLKRLMRVPF